MTLKGLSVRISFRTMNLLACLLLCPAAFSQIKSVPEKKDPEAQFRTIPFGINNYIRYDLGNGTYNVFFNGNECIKDAYALCNATALLDSRRSWSVRRYSFSSFSDASGKGTRHTITLSGDGQQSLQQVFTVFRDRNYFFTELKLTGDGSYCDYMAPLVSDQVQLDKNGENRALFVPFDNDAWVRYNALPLYAANFTSGEVSALYNNDTRHGLIVGSIEHSDWKSGVRINGTDSGIHCRLSAFGGYTDSIYTHDKIKHGRVGTGDGACRSPRMMVGWFDDWRTGLEEYGKANRIAEPRYVFKWNKATPFGWNSWGAIQDKLSLSKAKAVVDFFADSCKGFRNADSALYIDLDSYWDNMRTGGSNGDFSQLISFCNYCKKKGFIPGVYWAPFTDWGKNAGRSVEGSEYKYAECWTKAKGQYNDLDGARAMDPTHPATRLRIAWMIKRLKECGFQMIKIDFLGHGTLEADRFYDSTVHTGMQAFRQGMEYLIDQLDGKMLVYAAISPNLATGRYTHMRRIACDSYKSINESAYTLNSTQYGWWLNKVYDYLDADHVVFEKESPGANRARLASALITGTLITGDDYSANGKWRATAQTLLQNKDLLRVAGKGISFRPVEGNTGNQAGELFIRITADQACLAIINYGKNPKKYSIDLDRVGLDGSRNYTGIKELFSEQKLCARNKLEVEIEGEDAALYIFR